MRMMKTPGRISSFPKAPISNSQISNVKVQMTNECQMTVTQGFSLDLDQP